VQKITIANQRNLKLAGLLYAPEQPDRQATPLLIVCHGFNDTKENEGRALEMAEWLHQRNVACLLFDFAGFGESEGEHGDPSISHRLEDIGSVVTFCRALGWTKLGILGRSLGGTTALIYAAQDDYIRGVCTWAAPVYLPDLAGDSGTSKEEELIADLTQIVYKISPRPLLLVHGTEDTIVPLQQSRDLLDAAGEPKKLFVVPGADHRFTRGYTLIWEAILEWIDQWTQI